MDGLTGPKVSPRLFAGAVVLGLLLAAAALWWLTGGDPSPSTITVTPGSHGGSPPTPKGPTDP